MGYVHQKQTYVPLYSIHIKLIFQYLINKSNMYEKRGYMLIY